MIQEEDFQGHKVFSLENNTLKVLIAPQFGANMFSLYCKKHRYEVLKKPPSPELLKSEPVMWGTPILFPPNRIRNAKFTYENKNYTLPVNTSAGHHIHGMCFDRPWRFASLQDDDSVSLITFTFEFSDHVDLLQTFPHALKLSYTISLVENSIESKMEIENLSGDKVPIGLGFHTWFNLGSKKSDWHLQLPFEKIWELDEESFPTGNLVTGELVDLLRAGINLGDKQFDTLFYIGTNRAETTLVREDGFSITYSVSDKFKHWIAHTETKQQKENYIAIEPYSWVTNAPNLQLPDSLTGVGAISPKGSAIFSSRIQVG